jgi:hypothetical protein
MTMQPTIPRLRVLRTFNFTDPQNGHRSRMEGDAT